MIRPVKKVGTTDSVGFLVPGREYGVPPQGGQSPAWGFPLTT